MNTFTQCAPHGTFPAVLLGIVPSALTRVHVQSTLGSFLAAVVKIVMHTNHLATVSHLYIASSYYIVLKSVKAVFKWLWTSTASAAAGAQEQLMIPLSQMFWESRLLFIDTIVLNPVETGSCHSFTASSSYCFVTDSYLKVTKTNAAI